LEQGFDKEDQKIMEGMADKTLRRRRPSSAFKPPDRSPLILGLSVLILIAVLGLFFRGGNQVSPENLNAISAQLDRLQERLTQLQGPEQEAAHLESQVKGLHQSLSELEKTSRSVEERIGELSQNIERLQQKIAAPPALTTLPRAAPKMPAHRAKARYHEVRRGDTLYRIAKRYGMSVDDLKRLNHFTKDQVIQPGQKILITPGND
jgi:LysM repeat protein